jgi:hypothetical protein
VIDIWWKGRDSNPRPRHYESKGRGKFHVEQGLTNGVCRNSWAYIGRFRSVPAGFSAHRGVCARNARHRHTVGEPRRTITTGVRP